MVTVLKETEHLKFCPRCLTRLIFDESDVKVGPLEGYIKSLPTIVCPECRNIISVNFEVSLK